MHNVETILATIAGEYPIEFPDFTNIYLEYAGAKLHCFRSEKKWAIVTEEICYNVKLAEATIEVHSLGNGLVNFIHCIESYPLVDNIDESFIWLNDRQVLAENAKELRVKGININIEKLINRSQDIVTITEVLRALVDNYRDILFMHQKDLRKNIQDDLHLIMTLDEWYHPQLNEDLTKLESIQMIAQVLASGDIRKYKPTVDPNTHWSNWQHYFEVN